MFSAQEAVRSPRGKDPTPQLKNHKNNPALSYCHIREDVWQAVQKRAGTREHVKQAIELRIELDTRKRKNLEWFGFKEESISNRVFLDSEFYPGMEKLDLHIREARLRGEVIAGETREFIKEIAEARAVHLMMEALGRAWMPCQSHTQDMGLEESGWMATLVQHTVAREQWRYEHGDGDYPEDMRDYLSQALTRRASPGRSRGLLPGDVPDHDGYRRRRLTAASSSLRNLAGSLARLGSLSSSS